MTEKDITLCEGDGSGNGGDAIGNGYALPNVMQQRTYEAIDGGGTCLPLNKSSPAMIINKNTGLHHNNVSDVEDGFLSASPDSANGDTTTNNNNNNNKHNYNKHNNSHSKHVTVAEPATLSSTPNPNTTTMTTMTATNAPLIKMSTISILKCTCPGDCVTLKNICDSFKTPLSEEQAWAILYQFTMFYHKFITIEPGRRYIFSDLELPETMENLNLHRDGSVHCSWSEKERCDKEQKMRERQALQVAIADHDNDCVDGGTHVIGRAFDNHSAIMASHRMIIRKLAVIVYTALDYNLQADEECQMSQELEELFTYMTADETDDDCIDEGIDEGNKRWDDESDDHNCNETKELDYILEACRKHVKPTIPEDHYRAVCRALVTETIELRLFLQQVLNNGAEKLHLQADTQASQQELAKLGFNDWARFWVQVIDELRRGVRLKKCNYERAPIEYELTPYEILMEDIRSKKYQLRKVMVNGDIPPRVKKDAHAVILEFIRSRPPLKKASERKLPPPIKRTPSPREQLMDSIRKGQTLKHITPPRQPRLKDRLLPTTTPATASTAMTTSMPSTTVAASLAGGGAGGSGAAAANMSASEHTELPRSKQRLIKVDFSLLQDDDNFFDESTASISQASSSKTTIGNTSAANIGICSQPKMPPYPIGGYMVAAPATAATTGNNMQAAPMTTRNMRRTTYDLATQCESRRASVRRHSIVGCQSNNPDESQSMPPTRPESRQSQVGVGGVGTATTTTAAAAAGGNASDVSITKELHNNYNQQQQQQQQLKRSKSPANATVAATAAAGGSHNCNRSASSLGPWNKSFLDKKTWMERGDDRLSLTLEEIVHIRSVMTKAELEGLPVGVRVKEDVEKRKVCFLCLRTRFSIFGPWGIQCKLCQRTVCSKCYTKMRIPTEHFRNVPLVLISPSLLSSPASSSTPSPSHHASGHYGTMHASSTGNIMDDTFPKTLIERLLRSESERKTRNSVGSAPSSPKHQRSNMSTPGGGGGQHAAAVAAAGHAVEALQDDTTTGSQRSAAICNSYSGVVKPSPQQLAAAKANYNLMSRSMEGPRSLPVHSPARTHSNSSTLDRKSRFARGFTLSASGSHLVQDQKENMRGEQVPVCNDCQGLVNEITSSAKQKRSSARNRTLQNLTLDLSPVWK